MGRIRGFALIALAVGFGSAACSNTGQSGPTAMGATGATINGAIVVEGGSAKKHAGGGGSASVPGLVVTVAGTNISAL
ncbi:MAG TPA: hypothetical protein VFO31_08440, partial [Vicinamibacterales bacterium]|nr:hypothetical protein [Vicinamibacterales bacterium]